MQSPAPSSRLPLLAAAAAASALLVLAWWLRLRRRRCAEVGASSKQLLAELTRRTAALIAALQERHPSDARTAALLRNWRGVVHPTGRPDPHDVAYTINKTHMYICTHSPHTGSANDVNSSMHVLLHELAHMATAEMHHPAAFWDNSQFLMDEAQLAGLYEPIEDGTMFCGRPLRTAA